MSCDILLFLIGISYNQPKFSQYASWNPNAVTFTNMTTVGLNAYGLFININNTVYVTETQNSRVQVWLEGDTTPTRTFSAGLAIPFGIFASISGDIYVDNGYSNGRVDKWTLNATIGEATMYVKYRCLGVFTDIYDNLYCSLYDFHQVLKRSFNDDANITTIVAGSNTSGNTSDMLNYPRGIFIDIEFNLYVADAYNHRIQLFRQGLLNATTIAINGSYGTFILNYPTDVILDGNGYLFISDTNNNRIIGSFSNGFKCIIGCSGVSGNASNQLDTPWSINFDSYGNLFIVDGNNSRIQKFLLATNFSGK